MLDDLHASSPTLESILELDRHSAAYGRPFRQEATRWPTATSTATPRPRRRKPNRCFPAEVLTDAEVRALMDACGME